MESKSRIRTTKAYSSVNDARARFPKKNFADVTEAALGDTHEDDTFTHLVQSAPTVDISNLNTSKLTDEDNVEVFKQNVLISSKNMFTVAQDALIRHPQLKKIILMEHAPRYDGAHVDPTQLKPKLAKLANDIYAQLWHSSALKEKIIVASHNLDCSDDLFKCSKSSSPLSLGLPCRSHLLYSTLPVRKPSIRTLKFKESQDILVRSLRVIYTQSQSAISLTSWETARLYRDGSSRI